MLYIIFAICNAGLWDLVLSGVSLTIAPGFYFSG